MQASAASSVPRPFESLVWSLKKLNISKQVDPERREAGTLCDGESHLSSRIHEDDWKPSPC